ncbi:hypothetical protein EMCRGX_G025699 [Ephydatia muelleri]
MPTDHKSITHVVHLPVPDLNDWLVTCFVVVIFAPFSKGLCIQDQLLCKHNTNRPLHYPKIVQCDLLFLLLKTQH